MRGFMEIKGIDVSAWQGKINWKTVADYGMGFAILRITEAGNVIDSTFEANYEGCSRHQIPTGVYKYSYAMTPQESVREAEKVIQVLNGRKLRFPVFLDLEWNNQRALGASGIEKIAEAFKKIIITAGYRFGIYCNVDWYQTMISSSLKKNDFWIARYPAHDDGTLHEKLRPDFGVGWQYSSKAKIPGISGYVDRDVFYKDYTDENAGSGGQNKKERLFVGMVTASMLNVRTWAGTEYPRIKSYPVLARGNLVDVMNYTQTAADGSIWYYIRIAGKYYGFVHSQYILRQ